MKDARQVASWRYCRFVLESVVVRLWLWRGMNTVGGVVRRSRVGERMSEGAGERMSEDEGEWPKKSVGDSLRRAELGT